MAPQTFVQQMTGFMSIARYFMSTLYGSVSTALQHARPRILNRRSRGRAGRPAV